MEKLNDTLRLAACGAGLCGFASLATASPVTYDVVTGASSNVTLIASNANNGNTLLSDGVLPMTSASLVEFDPAAMTLPSFDFADSGPTTLGLSGALAAYSLEITSLNVAPLSPYSSTVTSTGTNSYNFTLGELAASGNWQLIQNSSGDPVPGQSGTFNHTVSTFTGQFGVSGADLQNLTLTGISLGQVTIEGTPVNLSADVMFNGATAVPLPAGIWLLGSGLAGLLSAGARRRRNVTA